MLPQPAESTFMYHETSRTHVKSAVLAYIHWDAGQGRVTLSKLVCAYVRVCVSVSVSVCVCM